MRDAHYQDATITLYAGDCLDVLADLPDNSVDSVCCDPPYGLANTDPAHVAETITRWVNGERDYLPGGSGFMGKAWDAFVPPVAVWDDCLRVLKPGGHLLAFSGSRTMDLMTLGLRLAGFEIRDSIAWLYGSGFPKSLDVSKAIDRIDATDARRARNLSFTEWMRSTGVSSRQIDAATSSFMGGHYLTAREQAAVPTADMFDLIRPLLDVDVPEWVEALVTERTVESENFKAREVTGQRTTGLGTGKGAVAYIADSENRDITAPATDAARTWQGWGTALKPAFEPIVVARKPLAGTVAANVLAHGTGALNINGCRTPTNGETLHTSTVPNDMRGGHYGSGHRPGEPSGQRRYTEQGGTNFAATSGPRGGDPAGRWPANVILDESQAAVLDAQGGASQSRVGKPRGADAGDGWGMTATGAECDDEGGASRFFYVAKADAGERVRVDGIAHPTVKPLDLMRWLVRLVTPPGGTVLEPFAGSGTTVEACLLEGFHCIAIEREADYLPLIVQRVNRRRDPVAAVKGSGGDAGLFDLLEGA